MVNGQIISLRNFCKLNSGKLTNPNNTLPDAKCNVANLKYRSGEFFCF